MRRVARRLDGKPVQIEVAGSGPARNPAQNCSDQVLNSA
jgi:hypothetical protein